MKSYGLLLSFLFLGFLTACSAVNSRTPFVGAEPEVNTTVTRAPRTLRLYFEQLPNVERSQLNLRSADGREVALRGMHTMGANDLMVEINDQVPNGRYTVTWTTEVEGDSTQYSGSFEFLVETD